MAETRYLYLFMYDIQDDTTRSRVHGVLRRWGEPLQYSIFQVHCTTRELARIQFELSRHLQDGYRLTTIRLCRSCAARVSHQGDLVLPPTASTPTHHIV